MHVYAGCSRAAAPHGFEPRWAATISPAAALLDDPEAFSGDDTCNDTRGESDWRLKAYAAQGAAVFLHHLQSVWLERGPGPWQALLRVSSPRKDAPSTWW